MVYIKNLVLETVVGVYDWEQKQLRRVYVDLELATDCQKIAATDALDAAHDYAAISAYLREVAAASKTQLIETLAERLIQHLFQRFSSLTEITLSLSKPGAVPEADTVGVRIHRSRVDAHN